VNVAENKSPERESREKCECEKERECRVSIGAKRVTQESIHEKMREKKRKKI